MTNVFLFGIQGSMHASYKVCSSRLKTEEKDTDHFYVIGKINLNDVVTRTMRTLLGVSVFI